MPRMNGIDATRAIRRREDESGRARTPILAVTANAMTDQIAEYRAAGIDDVVAKPVDLAILMGAIQQAMSAAEAIQIEAAESQIAPASPRLSRAALH